MRLAQKPDRLSLVLGLTLGVCACAALLFAENANAAQTKSVAAHSSSARDRTPDAPPVFKLLPSPKTNADLAAETRDRKAQAEAAEKTERLNTWLVVIAALLAALGVAHGAALVLGLRLVKRSADAALNAAVAAGTTAEAAARLDLPILFMTGARAIPRQLRADDLRDLPLTPAVMEFKFENFGRTPASVTALCLESRVCATLPREPTYAAITAQQPGPVILPQLGQVVALPEQPLCLSADEIERLRYQHEHLFLYGFITYLDFLGKLHRLGFCLKWRPADGNMASEGFFETADRPTYIYQT